MPNSQPTGISPTLVAKLLPLQNHILGIGAQTELKSVLYEIAQEARTFFHAANCIVIPYEKSSDTFQLTQATTAIHKRGGAQTLSAPRATGTTRHVLKLPRGIWSVPNVARAAKRHPALRQGIGAFKTATDVQALIGVRLEAGAAREPVGVLFINWARPRELKAFEPPARWFANLAAIAIANARLWESERKARAISESLHQAVGDILTRGDSKQVIDALLDQMKQIIPYDAALVGLLKNDTMTAQTAKGFDGATETVLRFQFDAATDAIFQRMVQSRAPVILGNVNTETEWKPVPGAEWVTSWFGFPLRVQNETIGQIGLYKREANFYNQTHIPDIENFANTAALAIQYAVTHDANQRARALTLVLQETSAHIAQEQDLHSILTQMLEGAFPLTGSESGVVYLFNADLTEIVEEYETPKGLHPRPRMDNPEGVTRTIIHTGAPVVIPDVSKDDRVAPKVRASGVQSLIGFPLKAKERVIGVIYLNAKTLNPFGEIEQQRLGALGEQAVVAIENTRAMASLRAQTEQMDLLYQATAQISRQFSDLKEALQAILAIMTKALGMPRGAVVLYAHGKGQLVAAYAREANIITPAGVEFEMDTALQKELWQARKQVQLTDIAHDPRLNAQERAVFQENGITSSLLVPMIVRERVIGSIGVDALGETQTFAPEQIQLCQTLANHAAIVVQNMRLYERRKTLQAIARDLTSELDVDKLLDKILDGALQVFGCPVGAIAIPDPKTGQLVYHHAVGKQVGSHVAVGRGLMNAAFQLGEPIRVDDVTRDGRYHQVVKTTKAEMDVPLLFQNQALGVLNFESPMVGGFTKDDEEAAVALAAQAAVALQNAKRYRSVEILNEMGKELTGDIRLRENEIIELIHEKASQLIDARNMYIALYDKAADTVRFPLAFKNGELFKIETRRAGKGKTEEILRTGKPIFHPTQAEADAWYREPERKDYTGSVGGSWIGVPMLLGDQPMGVIAAYDPQRDYVYAPDDVGILQTIANQAAIAIDNARLYYDTNKRLEILVEVGQKLTSKIERREQDILDEIYKGAQRLTEARDMYIALYDETSNTITFKVALKDGKFEDITSGIWAPRQADKKKRGKTEEIIFTALPLFHKTGDESDAWYQKPGHAEFQGRNSGTWLGVPMMVGNKVLGVLVVYDFEREYAYDEQDRDVLMTMANQAAIALENARLLEITNDEKSALLSLNAAGLTFAALQHELRNTLPLIPPNVKMLRRRIVSPDSDTTEMLDIIERNSIDALTGLRRLNDVWQDPEPATVNLNALLSEVIEDAKVKYAQNTALSFETKFDETLPLLRAPVGQITEVFRNLIENACRSMKSGGKLTVRTLSQEDEIRVYVQDTGAGISPELAKNLFAPWAPGKPSSSRGMGLVLSYWILKSLRGEIRAESTGGGTRMLVRIPVEEHDETPQA